MTAIDNSERLPLSCTVIEPWPCIDVANIELTLESTTASKTSVNASELRKKIRAIRSLMHSQNHNEAQSLLDTLSDIISGHSELLTLQGQIYASTAETEKARDCFMKATAADPSNTEAKMNLAFLFHRENKLLDCLEIVKEVHSLEPDNMNHKDSLLVVLNDLGTQLKNEGNMEESQARYQEALNLNPNYAPVLYNLGVIESESGNATRARDFYTKAVTADPSHAQAWGNLGSHCACQDELLESLVCFRRAIAAQPDILLLHQSIAKVLARLGAKAIEMGFSEDGMRAYDEALAHDPTCMDALYNLAIVYSNAGQKHRAIFLYETTIRHYPTFAEAYNNLGAIYKELEHDNKAIQCFLRAIQINPNFAIGYSNIGLIYAIQGRVEESIDMLHASIKANPQNLEAYNNLGVIQKDAGMTQESMASYEKCLRIDPLSRNPADNLLLGLNYVMCGSDTAVSSHHMDWGLQLSRQFHPLPPIDYKTRNASENKVLRIGYLSGDLFTHSVSYFVEAPFSTHNPSNVSLFVYNCSTRTDDKTALLRQAVLQKQGTWKDVKHLSEVDLAHVIRGDEIDILVELSGHTSGNRLGTMVMKPAPVQVTWIGYPNSTGLRQVDYRITDANCDSEDTTQVFSEKLVRLPNCFLCYTPIVSPPPIAPAPCLENGFITFGSFNNLAKVTDEVIRVWSMILVAVPDSRLVIKNKTFACHQTRARFSRKFKNEGIESWRLDLLPLSHQTKEHLSLYSLMDISLDPWPYAGTTTTCESFLMGVPCLTLAGKCHAQNVGVSLVRAAGLDDSWIARSTDQYVTQAVNKSSDFTAIASLREQLRTRMLQSNLCDREKHTRQLEAAYRQMWQEWMQSSRSLY